MVVVQFQTAPLPQSSLAGRTRYYATKLRLRDLDFAGGTAKAREMIAKDGSERATLTPPV